jgi:hypothetical protein
MKKFNIKEWKDKHINELDSVDKAGNLDAYDQKKNPGDYHSPKEHDAMYKRSWYPSYTKRIKALFNEINKMNRYSKVSDENILMMIAYTLDKDYGKGWRNLKNFTKNK